MMSGTVPAVGNGYHYIPVETDAFEIVLRVFADEPVKHGVEVDAQFSAVCGILYQFFNLLVKLPFSDAVRGVPYGRPWRLILPAVNNRSDIR